MSYHHCPIEPSDWSDGPDDGDECETCEGTGEVDHSSGGVGASADTKFPCPDCGGKGYLDGGDYEPQMDDVI